MTALTDWRRWLVALVIAAATAGVTAQAASAGFGNCSTYRMCYWDAFNGTGSFAQWDHHNYAGGTWISLGGFANKPSSYENADPYRVFVADSSSSYSTCLPPGQYGNFGAGNNIIDRMAFTDYAFC